MWHKRQHQGGVQDTGHLGLETLTTTRAAKTTRPPVLIRFIPILPAMRIRPTAFTLFFKTLPVLTTRPTVRLPSSPIPPVTVIRLAVIMRSLLTRRHPTTQPVVFTRYRLTQPASSTQPMASLFWNQIQRAGGTLPAGYTRTHEQYHRRLVIAIAASMRFRNSNVSGRTEHCRWLPFAQQKHQFLQHRHRRFFSSGKHWWQLKHGRRIYNTFKQHDQVLRST